MSCSFFLLFLLLLQIKHRKKSENYGKRGRGQNKKINKTIKKYIHSEKVEKGDGDRRKNQIYAFMYN